jgi:hypothetical protein
VGVEELEQLARSLALGFSPRHLASDIDENLALLFFAVVFPVVKIFKFFLAPPISLDVGSRGHASRQLPPSF